MHSSFLCGKKKPVNVFLEHPVLNKNPSFRGPRDPPFVRLWPSVSSLQSPFSRGCRHFAARCRVGTIVDRHDLKYAASYTLDAVSKSSSDTVFIRCCLF